MPSTNKESYHVSRQRQKLLLSPNPIFAEATKYEYGTKRQSVPGTSSTCADDSADVYSCPGFLPQPRIIHPITCQILPLQYLLAISNLIHPDGIPDLPSHPKHPHSTSSLSGSGTTVHPVNKNLHHLSLPSFTFPFSLRSITKYLNTSSSCIEFSQIRLFDSPSAFILSYYKGLLA